MIRGNASEILALSGAAAQGRGADAADPVAAAEAAARDLAVQSGATVAVTGAVDYVTDGTQAIHMTGGHPMMTRVTAMGCALTGVVAAFTAKAEPFEATTGALAYFGAAGEIAARTAKGPGSFQVAFLDALYAMTGDDLDAMARIAPRDAAPVLHHGCRRAPADPRSGRARGGAAARAGCSCATRGSTMLPLLVLPMRSSTGSHRSGSV